MFFIYCANLYWALGFSRILSNFSWIFILKIFHDVIGFLEEEDCFRSHREALIQYLQNFLVLAKLFEILKILEQRETILFVYQNLIMLSQAATLRDEI